MAHKSVPYKIATNSPGWNQCVSEGLGATGNRASLVFGSMADAGAAR